MELRETFKFNLGKTMEFLDFTFTAQRFGDKYIVSWNEDGKMYSTEYQVIDVAHAIKEGYWIVL